MVAIRGRKSSNKNPPIFSHEFVIQNHADIVSCVAMVFVVGLMVQATSPWAYIFIALHHNVTSIVPSSDGKITPAAYTNGWKDACAVFFYFLITIVMHAVIQEYVFDKITKKLKLSKSKLSKFNESSQLFVFYFLSVVWGLDIIFRENFIFNVQKLWINYPATMSFSLKFFFIAQIAYWLHCYPELYFQRVKKEDVKSKIVYSTTGLALTVAAYVLNFQQVGVCLIVLHHISECLLHVAKLIHFVSQKEKSSRISFTMANLIFFTAHLATIGLSALVFYHGLGQIKSNLHLPSGTYNIPAIRFSVLGVIVLYQLCLMYRRMKKISKHTQSTDAPATTKVQKVTKPRQKREKKELTKKSGGSEDDVSEGDQSMRRNLRSRTPKSTPASK